jgi:hypothetical protein
MHAICQTEIWQEMKNESYIVVNQEGRNMKKYPD